MDVTWNDLSLWAQKYLVPVGIKILIGLAIVLIGRSIARSICKGLARVMERSNMDVSLRKFLGDVVYAVLLAAVAIAALDTVGVRTTAVIAVLGAAGLAVGLALQGSLSNFAAGVMLIILRPYKVGDQVVIGKYEGRVDAIRVFQTVLVTADNREITIPNGKIISDPIENMTVLGTRRIDITVSVEHGTNLHQARQWLEGAVASDKRIHATPAPTVNVAEVGTDAVKLHLRPWTSVADYAAASSAALERIKDTLDSNGVKGSVALQ
jgi:small conductance mechanosensitive channel